MVSYVNLKEKTQMIFATHKTYISISLRKEYSVKNSMKRKKLLEK